MMAGSTRRNLIVAASALLLLASVGASEPPQGPASAASKPQSGANRRLTVPPTGGAERAQAADPAVRRAALATPPPSTPAATASASTPPASAPSAPSASTMPVPAGLLAPSADDMRGLKSVALIGLFSLAPAALLMFTSFVRINIVLILLRQALGSPQVPGNQVLTALAVLLSALVMKPVGESVYARAVEPYAAGKVSAREAWDAGTTPIKVFMVRQIERTGHVDYLWELYDYAEPESPGRVEPETIEAFPLRVVAPAFLLSELTTALMIGFLIYLPFLVIDLVVSAVLSAMGLFMLPPSMVALPVKLVLFVLADGWLLVASAMLRTFSV